MQHIFYQSTDFRPYREKKAALLHRYRGVIWGSLAGAPIGLATLLNMSATEPAVILGGVIAFLMAGGFCGHNMQQLLEGTR